MEPEQRPAAEQRPADAEHRADAEQRVVAAERAAAPWWRAAVIAGLVQSALAVVVLVVVLTVQLNGTGQLIDRSGFLTLGAAVVTPFAAAAVVVSVLALLLIRKRHTTGLVSLTAYGVLVGAVLAQWILVLLDKDAPITGAPLLVLSFAVCLAAIAAAVVGAATLGRTMRVAKARNAIGARQY